MESRSTRIENLNYQEIESNVLSTNVLFRQVFAWMFGGLLLTTISSLYFGWNPEAMAYLITMSETGARLNILGWIVMLAPLGFVLTMSLAFKRLSFVQLSAIFILYALVNGISLGFIFYVYDIGSIFKAFMSAAALFGVMAIAGYTTKTDLTSLGRILFFGLIGIIIASLINFFMKSDTMDYVISVLGVIIFTGLTAYDVQKIKALSYESDGSVVYRKLGIMGALNLYLDFINLFLLLLRIFGGKRD
ncbi:MAG: Bax inhibitor-1/YccA family protein [Bacteroidetes bacterium]|nr:MAG: Bax inhibitor-1/YccA family protein [Bacteroidota bacterium]